MTELCIAPQAEMDLDDIWFYIAQDQPETADRYIDHLVDIALKLAVTPGMGVCRSELGASLQSFPVGRYILFYRRSEDGIELVRVLPAARDVGQVSF